MVAVIKYNAGNVKSVMACLSRLGADAVLTDDRKTILGADHVVFPGVGEASSAMAYLKTNRLLDTIKSIRKPFLGICLGMQLMARFSEEGASECLSIVEGNVKRFPSGLGYKIPHMGWNTISFSPSCPLFKGIEQNAYVYFVHSYYLEKGPWSAADAEYDGVLFSAAIENGNFLGTQFHPEKSGDTGERILENFLEWNL